MRSGPETAADSGLAPFDLSRRIVASGGAGGLGSFMAKSTKKPSPSVDPHVAAFRAVRDHTKSFTPKPPKSTTQKPQKPRPKQQLRRRP